MSGHSFHTVLQNNFKRSGKQIKQVWENVKVHNKLIKIGDLDLFIFVFLFNHSPPLSQTHSLVCLAHGGHSIYVVN